jgi:glyoxylase-like metal-dependent hydrolase (beta-lactamase superfamily II)
VQDSHGTDVAHLPPGLKVFERGWLSSNNILLVGDDAACLVDSGYCTHAPQTLSLVEAALGDRPLDLLVNTHLHSDHCGGNATLQARYPRLRTLIPPGQAAHVRDWDPQELSYAPTGQSCPRFSFDDVLRPGSEARLAGVDWQVHAAPGHDPHSVVLFEPRERVLISADALWENGFGVVFPELEGSQAFDEVSETLALIEALAPELVIPGHGAVFADVSGALANARRRLDGFMRHPSRHAQHASKVLLKFKLLELQRVPIDEFRAWAARTAYLEVVRARYFPDQPMMGWLDGLLHDLARSGAAVLEENWVGNA